jgi:hypothetical protein
MISWGEYWGNKIDDQKTKKQMKKKRKTVDNIYIYMLCREEGMTKGPVLEITV